MPTENTVRVSLRIRTPVHAAILEAAAEQGIDPSAFMQRTLEEAVRERLPEELRREIENREKILRIAEGTAVRVHGEGRFDEHFTLTVFRELMADASIRRLYEEIIGADAYKNGAPKKSPLNMYLGYFIKNAVGAAPLLDNTGKPRRAFVRNEVIQSYTLLTLS